VYYKKVKQTVTLTDIGRSCLVLHFVM